MDNFLFSMKGLMITECDLLSLLGFQFSDTGWMMTTYDVVIMRWNDFVVAGHQTVFQFKFTNTEIIASQAYFLTGFWRAYTIQNVACVTVLCTISVLNRFPPASRSKSNHTIHSNVQIIIESEHWKTQGLYNSFQTEIPNYFLWEPTHNQGRTPTSQLIFRAICEI